MSYDGELERRKNILERLYIADRFIAGKYTILAAASSPPYQVIITNIERKFTKSEFGLGRCGNIFYLKHSRNPVFAGFWMGWPEEHWGINDTVYRKLSKRDRAQLEAIEQLKWIVQEYDDMWKKDKQYRKDARTW